MIVSTYGKSMAPHLLENDLLWVERLDPICHLKFGQIYLLKQIGTNQLLAHRYLGTDAIGNKIFKGDRTKYSDFDMQIKANVIGQVIGRFIVGSNSKTISQYTSPIHSCLFQLMACLSKGNCRHFPIIHHFMDSLIFFCGRILRSTEERYLS